MSPPNGFFFYAMLACFGLSLLLAGAVFVNNGKDAFKQYDIAYKWYGRAMLALMAGVVCLMLEVLTNGPR